MNEVAYTPQITESSSVHDVFHSKDGYTFVWQTCAIAKLAQNIDNYGVKIVPSINMHDDDNNSFMLFQLLPQGLNPGLSEGHQHMRTDGESDLLQMSWVHGTTTTHLYSFAIH